MTGSWAEWRWLAVAVLAAVAAGVVVTALPNSTLITLPLAVPPMLLLFAKRKGWIGSPLLSTVWIPVLTLSAVGLAGYLFSANLLEAGGASYRIALTHELSRRTLLLFAELAIWVTVGALAVAAFRRPEHRQLPPLTLPSSGRGWFVAAIGIPAAMMIVGTGSELLSRDEYLPYISGNSLTNVAGNLAVGAAGLAGYLAASERGPRRWLSVAVALTYLALFFSIGSRRLAIVPLLFVVGICAWRGTRHRGRYVVAGILLAVFLLPVPLYLRSSSGSHGLIPYLGAMSSFSFAKVDWQSAVNNILVAYPITAAAAYVQPPAPTSWLFIALNPAPGDMAGWYDIADKLRLNFYTPFSTVGELGNHGPMATAAVGLAIGALLAYLDGRAALYFATGRAVFSLGLIGMSAIYAVTILQYNLRSSVRLLLYAVALDVLFRCLAMWRLRLRGPQDAPAAPRRAAISGPAFPAGSSPPTRR